MGGFYTSTCALTAEFLRNKQKIIVQKRATTQLSRFKDEIMNKVFIYPSAKTALQESLHFYLHLRIIKSKHMYMQGFPFFLLYTKCHSDLATQGNWLIKDLAQKNIIKTRFITKAASNICVHIIACC